MEVHAYSRKYTNVASESPSFDHIFFAVNASLRVIKTGPKGMGREGSRDRTRSLAHLSRPQSTVQDKSPDVMLLLTNGIARNSALSYEHVCDGRLSRRHRSLSLSLSPRNNVYLNPFRLPLVLYLSISMSRETLTPEPRWRFTMAEVVMTVLSR